MSLSFGRLGAAGALFCGLLALPAHAATGRKAAAAAAGAAAHARGAKIFAEKCALCHQAAGQGAPAVYPPLAGSDFFAKNRGRVIAALCEGLSDPIVVNGQPYSNIMPAQVLDDGQVSDVLTFVGQSWGNKSPAVTPREVAAARHRTRFPTYQNLVTATAYRPLPAAPAGWSLREVAQLPEFCTRLAGREDGRVYILGQRGAIFVLDEKAGAVAPLVQPAEYADLSRGDLTALGMAQDAEGRLWFVTDQRVRLPSEKYYQNEVSIYRTSSVVDGNPAAPRLWFRTHYNYGIGGFNHGVSTLGFGPDGMLYLNSGSRTDGGEAGNLPEYSPEGETELTACIWRLDPKAGQPSVEVFARGIRNAFGFAWDDGGRLFTVSNGPDFSAPEEMDCVEQGRHYGFPFQYANWPVKPHFPYPHTPPPPPGLEFTFPVANLGPAGGGSSDAPCYTFEAHSSPAGMLWRSSDAPAPFQGGFLVTRFGNLLGAPATPSDTGFDLLFCRLEKAAGEWRAHTEVALAPLARPLDLLAREGGRILILEYTRPVTFREKLGWLPGRILELAPLPGLHAAPADHPSPPPPRAAPGK